MPIFIPSQSCRDYKKTIKVVFGLSLDDFQKNWIVEGLECTEAVLARRTACIPMLKRRNAFCVYGVSGRRFGIEDFHT